METIKYMRRRRRRRSQTSAQKVASNDDLLTEILLRLPITSLTHFKFVSNHWFSLITRPHFSLLRMKPSGLFLQTSSSFYEPVYEYIPFNSGTQSKPPPFRTPLTFTPDYYGINILQSCNGFLLCCSSERDRKYYVYNPTTKQCITLPLIPGKPRRIHSMVLAFDPSISPHFKVVCVSQFNRKLCQMVIYSSEAESWNVNGQPFSADGCNNFRRGVYLNGAIHWTGRGRDYSCYYFKIDEERLETLIMPRRLPGRESCFSSRNCFGPSYFGVSRGHLHHVETHGPHCTGFDVYEMEKDYSRWFVKYHVDLVESPGPFQAYYLDPVPPNRFRIQMLSIVRGEREEDSFLVLQIAGDVLEYNPVEKSLKKLCDFTPDQPYSLDHVGSKAFEFIESLSSV